MPMKTIPIVLAFCAVLVTGNSGAQEAVVETDGPQVQWAIQNYDIVVEHVFGRATSTDPLPQGALWVLTARIRPAYDDDPEVQISIVRKSDGSTHASLTRLRSPLIEQVAQIRTKNPNLPAADVARLVAAQRNIVTQAEYPSLAKLVASFERLRASVAVENVMVLDPRQYQVWVDAGSQQVYLNLLGPADGAGRHALIRWVEDAVAKLELACKRKH